MHTKTILYGLGSDGQHSYGNHNLAPKPVPASLGSVLAFFAGYFLIGDLSPINVCIIAYIMSPVNLLAPIAPTKNRQKRHSRRGQRTKIDTDCFTRPTNRYCRRQPCPCSPLAAALAPRYGSRRESDNTGAMAGDHKLFQLVNVN
jgi:hypothetical protein